MKLLEEGARTFALLMACKNKEDDQSIKTLKKKKKEREMNISLWTHIIYP